MLDSHNGLPWRRLAAALLVVALIAAGCGSREKVLDASGAIGGVGGGGLSPSALGGPGQTPTEAGTVATGDPVAGGGQASGARSGGAQAGGAGSGGGGGVAATGATDVGISDTTITLGNTTSLSGAMAGQFDGTPNAAFAYLRSLNEAGGFRGRMFDLQILDDGLDGTRNLSQTRKLVEESKVFAMVGNATPVQNASSNYLRDKGVPVVGTVPATDGCKNPNAVPCYLSDNKWSGAAESFLGPQGSGVGKKVALVWIAQEISRDQAVGARAALEKYGWDVVFEFEAQLAEADFTPFVVQAKQNGADFVYSVMEVFSNIRLNRAMSRQSWTVPLFGLVNYDDNVLSNLGEAANNIWAPGVGPVLFTDPLPAMQQFRDTFFRYFPDGKLGPFTFLGWLYARLLVERGLNQLGADLTRSALLDAFNQTRGWTGDDLYQPLSIFPRDTPQGQIPPLCTSIVRVVNQKFETVNPKTCVKEPTGF